MPLAHVARSLLFLALILFFRHSSAIGKKVNQDPLDVLKFFISDINTGKYKNAYQFFSKPLREKVSYGDFHDGAKGVKSVKLVSANLLQKNSQIAKARVTIRDLEKYPDEKKWHPKKYAGDVLWIRENGEWHFIQVMLEGGKHGN